MAVIKRIASKGSVRIIVNYVLSKEKTDERIISGKDCSPENSVSEMNATKELYNKTGGLSYHHIIQSFKPGEITPEKAHGIGIELSEKQFKDHEVLIATHKDKNHIHNHLIVNSVSFKDGYKLISDKKTLREIKLENDRICKRENLSTIEKPYARNRYSMAEYKLAEKGIPIWKEQLRTAIDEAKNHSRNLVELKEYLKDNFKIDMKIQNKNLSFLHPDKKKYCRGNKLGHAYIKETINNEFERGRDPVTAAGLKEENNLNKTDTAYKDRSPGAGLAGIGSGIDNITRKISRDIEKEKIRVDKVKEHKYHSREKHGGRNGGRER